MLPRNLEKLHWIIRGHWRAREDCGQRSGGGEAEDQKRGCDNSEGVGSGGGGGVRGEC